MKKIILIVVAFIMFTSASFSEEPVEKEGWYTVVLSFELMYNIL